MKHIFFTEVVYYHLIIPFVTLQANSLKWKAGLAVYFFSFANSVEAISGELHFRSVPDVDVTIRKGSALYYSHR